jgi:hypothetical protein
MTVGEHTAGAGPQAFPPPSASGDDARRVLSATVVLLVLAVGLPVYVVDWGSAAAPLPTMGLAYLVVLISSARLTRAIASGVDEMFRAFFYLFVYIFMGLSPLAQIAAGSFPMDNRAYSDETIRFGLLSVLLGIVCYEAGWFVMSRRGSRRPRARTQWSFSPARCVVVAFVGLGVVIAQIVDNGLSSFFVSRAQTAALLADQDPSTGQVLYNLQDKAAGVLTTIASQTLVFVALFAILYCRRSGLWPRPVSLVTDMLWRLLIVALVVANLVMNNPIGNSRVWFCLVLAAFLSIYVPFHRPRAVRRLLVVALFVFVFLFASLDAFRTATTERGGLVTGPERTFVTNPTYAMFQMHLTGIEYVASNGHTGGRQLAGAVFSFVPRSVWTDKPTATGQLIDPPLLRSTTLWTELDVDFGTAGTAVGFVLFGAGSAWLTRRATTTSAGFVAAVLPLAAVFQIFVLRGSLLPAAGYVYQLTAVLLLVALPVWLRGGSSRTGSVA